ncbi:MAG: FAD:protein FMN transferase, partial [Planctomycetota bacterium]
MNKNIVYPLITGAVLVLITIIYLLLGPGGSALIGGRRLVKAGTGGHMVMGTFAELVAMTEDVPTGNRCIDAALQVINDVNNLMSDYISDSEISRANRDAFAGPVELSPETFDVIRRSIEIS